MKECIREIVLSCGADLCGFADVERFSEAPEGFRPTDIYADCKSVICLMLALPKGLLKVNPRLIYGHYNGLSCPEVDAVAFSSAKKIENRFNCIAVPMPADSPYEYWDGERLEGRGLLSMKHIAVNAGLGSLGKSSLLLNKIYGNMVTIGAILTNLSLPSDPIAESICIEGCQKCMKACPVNAIENGVVNQKLCRQNTYKKTARGFDTVECNACRTVCPVNK